MTVIVINVAELLIHVDRGDVTKSIKIMSKTITYFLLINIYIVIYPPQFNIFI